METKGSGQTKDKKLLSDIAWIGSTTFMKGDYMTLQSKLPVQLFPGMNRGTAGARIRDVEDIRHVMSGGWQQITA